MNKDYWVNVTSIGSQYEIQMHIANRTYRHRPLNLRVLYKPAGSLNGQDIGYGDWIEGLPKNE